MSRGAQVVEVGEIGCFLNAKPPGSDALFGERIGRQLGWALIFLPDTHFHGKTQLLAKSAFLEPRADEHRFSRARQNHRGKPLAQAPAYPGEIIKRRSWSEKKRVEIWLELVHQLLCMFDPFAKLIRRDGFQASAEWL